MNEDKIVCPHCRTINYPLDNEDCDIEFTSMECVTCEKDFWMSRDITVEYTTWKD